MHKNAAFFYFICLYAFLCFLCVWNLFVKKKIKRFKILLIPSFTILLDLTENKNRNVPRKLYFESYIAYFNIIFICRCIFIFICIFICREWKIVLEIVVSLTHYICNFIEKKELWWIFFWGDAPLPPLILLRRCLIYSNFQNQGEAVFRLHYIIIKFSSCSFFAKLQNDPTATSWHRRLKSIKNM